MAATQSINVGFKSEGCNAPMPRGLWPTSATRLRPLPGLEGAHLPVALLLLARLPLHPGLRTARHEARQKIAARLAVLGIGGGNRRDRAARSRARIFPRHAGILFTTAEHGARSGARIGKIGRRRQLHFFLRVGRRRDRAGALGLVGGEERVELSGQAASAEGHYEDAAERKVAP